MREGFYEKHGIKVLVGERAITINRQEKVIHSSAGRTVFYEKATHWRLVPTRDPANQRF